MIFWVTCVISMATIRLYFSFNKILHQIFPIFMLDVLVLHVLGFVIPHFTFVFSCYILLVTLMFLRSYFHPLFIPLVFCLLFFFFFLFCYLLFSHHAYKASRLPVCPLCSFKDQSCLKSGILWVCYSTSCAFKIKLIL